MIQKNTFRFLAAITLLGLILVTCSNEVSNKKIISKPISNGETIKMEWKIPKGNQIKYQTAMNEIGNGTFEMDFGSLFDKLTESTATESKDSTKDFFKKLQKSFNNTNLITSLSNSPDFNNVIDIKMIAVEKNTDSEKSTSEDDTDMTTMMKGLLENMMKGVMLRGSVYKNGTLHSFWIKNSQKNLLSLFFELPNKELKIGDTWTLNNVNFISNDQNFICRKANKKNIITLTDIKEINGDVIAVVDYDILEYVSGDFNNPFSKSNTETTLKFIYRAKASFSINKGKWIAYNGIMSLDASGVMNSKQKKKFALIEK